MLSPLNYLKAINRRRQLQKAIALRAEHGYPSKRFEGELFWINTVIEAHFAAKFNKSLNYGLI